VLNWSNKSVNCDRLT